MFLFAMDLVAPVLSFYTVCTFSLIYLAILQEVRGDVFYDLTYHVTIITKSTDAEQEQNLSQI